VSDEEVYLVVNAGCVEKDLAHIGSHLDTFKVRLRPFTDANRTIRVSHGGDREWPLIRGATPTHS
jgi:glycine cleavage system aminomethyltransferase T